MNKLLLFLLILLALVACGGETAVSPETTATSQTTLSTNYDNALPLTGQLALGMIQLDDTDQAVDDIQAQALLPLWQALQSLSQSDTTAAIEIEAVVKQIQGTLTTAQLQAIADMALTSDSLAELQSSGGLGFGGFGRGNRQNGDSTDSSGFAGGPPGGGFAGGPPGGSFGGGGMPPGGMGGMPADGAVIDDATRATRQAAFAADGGSMSEQIYIMTAVRWLEVKTGTAVNPGNLMLEVVFPVVSDALGLTVAALQTEMATGQTLTEVITAQGGDVAAIRAALITAVSESNTMPDTTTAESIESFVDNLLTGQFGRPLEMATPTP